MIELARTRNVPGVDVSVVMATMLRCTGAKTRSTFRVKSETSQPIDVLLEVTEHHRYTVDLILTYCLRDAKTGGLVPSANIRMYRDARMAEVRHYHSDLRLERAIGPLPPARTIFERRVRQSSFLNRWLEYLAEQGHSMGTLETADAGVVLTHKVSA